LSIKKSFKFLVLGLKIKTENRTDLFMPETGKQKVQTYILILALTGALLMTSACRQKMADQPRYDPLEPSTFFADGQSARPLVDNTVARGELRDDEHLYAGRSGNAPAATFPFPVTLETLQRGRERYDIYCSPCHSRTGYGDGMIARRGFGPPASLHTDLLRKQPPGHFFRVITQGFGAMPSYRQQIRAEDRWAIIAYIRALQLSQNATVNELPPEAREKLSREQP
jgi:mono/diheme cytochrome c family protein